MTFKNMKIFKQFVEYHQGINEKGIRIIENGVKAINKHGKVDVEYAISNIPPLPCAIPQHISSN